MGKGCSLLTDGFHCRVSRQGPYPSNIENLYIFSIEPVSPENKLLLIFYSGVIGLSASAIGDTQLGMGFSHLNYPRPMCPWNKSHL